MRLNTAIARFYYALITAVLLAFSLALSASAQTPTSSASEPVTADGVQATGGGSASAQDLANQVNNPNAPLKQIQLRNVVAPDLPGANGTGNLLQVIGVLPIPPSKLLPFPQLLKITIPMATLPQPVAETGLSDFNFFDVAVFKESWGSWGVGGTFVFPTASSEALGAGKWQAGPAAAIIYTGVENLVFGAVFQNPISYAGSPSRPEVNVMTVTPTLTYNWPSGWFAGYSDFDWTFNWKATGSSVATIPLGLQVGKVIHIGGQPFSLSAEVGYNVIRPEGTAVPQWMIGIEFTAILGK